MNRPTRLRFFGWLFCAVAALPAASARSGAEPSAPSLPPSAGEQAAALWRGLAPTLPATLTASRALLLGTRDPAGPSCVGRNLGKRFAFAARGGPGTWLAHHWYTSAGARTSPRADFAWHQTTLRGLLEDLCKRNGPLLAEWVRLADATADLAGCLRQTGGVPAGLAPCPVSRNTWPGRCAAGLVEAARGGRPDAACRWADELASAAFALADLHRWLDYLVRNQLAALDFQAQCRTAYETCRATYSGKFTFDPTLSCLPAGQLGGSALRNGLEVEHQAEWLFQVLPGRVVRRLDGTSAPNAAGAEEVAAALWMPPHLRPAFIELRGVLAPASRALWDRAAHSPYDRSYLANMLYRMDEAGVLDRLAVVLTRYDRAPAAPTQHGLMDVLFYRGGDPEGGADWGERFDPRLMAAAATLGGTDAQVILGAQHYVRALLGTGDRYGASPSVGAALDTGRFDCINATEVIGCLYGNAGRAGFYAIRWSGGTVGHSVAAADVPHAGGRALVIVDALAEPQTQAAVWPEAYFTPPRWPSAYRGVKADVQAVELYARGLDNYVWAEGYILRGPHAGVLSRAAVPYLPHRARRATLRVQQWPPAGVPPANNG